MNLTKSVVSATIALSLTASGSVVAEESCDIGKIHEEVFAKFKLPEVPSALEDCGIGGFLNFDFSFDFGDIDLSSLFCDFAKDVMGDFKKNMKVDFKIGKDGLNINSPIYSISTRGIDDLAKDLMYNGSGIKEGAPGVFDQIGTAYEGAINAATKSIDETVVEKRTGNNSSSGTGSTSNFAKAVRSGSTVNMSDIQKNLEELANINTIANTNTTVGSTEFKTIGGENQTINSSLGNINLTTVQQYKLEKLPESSLSSMTEKQLVEYLNLTEIQKIKFNVIPKPVPRNINRNIVSTKNIDTLRRASTALNSTITKVALTDIQKGVLISTNVNRLRAMDIITLSNFLKLTPNQRYELGVGIGVRSPSNDIDRDSIDKDLIDSLFN
jgi:hypothetical protein